MLSSVSDGTPKTAIEELKSYQIGRSPGKMESVLLVLSSVRTEGFEPRQDLKHFDTAKLR